MVDKEHKPHSSVLLDATIVDATNLASSLVARSYKHQPAVYSTCCGREDIRKAVWLEIQLESIVLHPAPQPHLRSHFQAGSWNHPAPLVENKFFEGNLQYLILSQQSQSSS